MALVINYYINKLENEGVNVKPCDELDEEGNIVGNNYPPDFWQLERNVKEVIEGWEFGLSDKECHERLIECFNYYSETYYSVKNIMFFNDISISEVINSSLLSQEYSKQLEIMENTKENFKTLKISKKIIRNINKNL